MSNIEMPVLHKPLQQPFVQQLEIAVEKHIRYLQEVESMPQTKLPGWYLRTKRIMDISIGITGLILLFPLFLLVAMLIKIDSPGPIFFSQVRVGKNVKRFKMYKFRTMVDKAEKNTGPVWSPGKNVEEYISNTCARIVPC